MEAQGIAIEKKQEKCIIMSKYKNMDIKFAIL